MTAAEFKPRLTRPEKGNPYYNTTSNGGWSVAIKGSPTDADCDVLHNCVGYAYGRFNEIGGNGFKYLRPVNAENFIQYKGECSVGDTPKVGACIVWRKGPTLDSADGAGHVAIVEQVISDTEIVTSESGWNCAKPFWTQNRKCGDGNWGQPADYHFLGFIYNPAVSDADIPKSPAVSETTQLYRVRKSADDAKSQIGAFSNLKNAVNVCTEEYAVYDTSGNLIYAKPYRLPNVNPYPAPTVPLAKGTVSDTVRWLQYALILHGYSCGSCGIDGVFGSGTERAVRAYQTVHDLSVTGTADSDLIAALKGEPV